MKKPLTLKQIRAAERKIGKKAAALIEDSIRKEIGLQGLKSNSSNEVKLYDSVKTKVVMGDVRLFRLSTTMARHGFIFQHGALKRSGHIKKRGKTFYSVTEHTFLLTKKPIIEVGIAKSGAFEYLFKELGALRMKEVAVVFKGTNIDFK